MAAIVCGMCVVASLIVYGQALRYMNDKPGGRSGRILNMNINRQTRILYGTMIQGNELTKGSLVISRATYRTDCSMA